RLERAYRRGPFPRHARTAARPLDADGRARRPAQRASRPPPERTAVSPAHVPRCDMVADDLRRRAWDAAASVVDPEIPALTIADLGVLRAVSVTDDGVEVAITPTYTGCPAMQMITLDIELALERAGIRGARVKTVLSPAWTTDWLSEAARAKLAASGI